jgi:hypothetical protein
VAARVIASRFEAGHRPSVLAGLDVPDPQQVTSPILCWYRDRRILVSVDAVRPAQQVSRDILTVLDAMRPHHEPARVRDLAELTILGQAFGATETAVGPSGSLSSSGQ